MRKLLMLTVLMAGVFAILPAQKVTILSPNGGETLVNGTPMLITWSYAKLSGDETLLIALEGSADFGPIAYSKVSAGSIEWLAGQKMDGSFAKPAGGYKIIIELVDNETAFDLSDQPFTIAAPVSVVALMTPNGGETLERGTDFDINWSFAGKDGFVSLILVKDDLPLGPIAENLPAASFRYRWHIGNPLLNGAAYTAGGNYRIHIQWQMNPNPPAGTQGAIPAKAPGALDLQKNSDRSDGVFSIQRGQTDREHKETEEKKR